MFKNAERVGLQELGPRFTLKLRSLQKGTFDSKFGEYEWVMVSPPPAPPPTKTPSHIIHPACKSSVCASTAELGCIEISDRLLRLIQQFCAAPLFAHSPKAKNAKSLDRVPPLLPRPLQKRGEMDTSRRKFFL